MQSKTSRSEGLWWGGQWDESDSISTVADWQPSLENALQVQKPVEAFT